MAHAYVPGDVFVFGKFDQIGHFTLLLVNVQVSVLQGNARAVVTPVFQSGKAFNEDRISVFGSDVSDYSAHDVLWWFRAVV
jgi:hypothetical protein